MAKIQYRVYKPLNEARLTIEQADEILCASVAAGWPSMTLRQLYYQFVARGLLPNTVKQYKRLGRVMTDGRYGGMIDWSMLEDADRNHRYFDHVPTAEEVLANIERNLCVNPWETQDYYIEVWVEKQALESTIARPCRQFQVNFMACKGYMSASESYSASLRFRRKHQQGKKCVLLHLGDHDPSGIDMTRDNDERLQELLAEVSIQRIALNINQVKQYSPPPNPAKETDSRFEEYYENYGSESWELDALDQSVISEIISEKIKTYIDWDKWHEAEEMQEIRRAPLAELSDRWNDVYNLIMNDDPGQLQAFLDATTDERLHAMRDLTNTDLIAFGKALEEAKNLSDI